MKKFLFFALLVGATSAFADDAKNEWHNTTLSEETIKHIQHAQYNYKQCVIEEMQKEGYAKIDSRNATGAIIKRCEAVLSGMRQVYLDAGVPEIIADRHMKKMRIDTTRRVLKQLMFAEAARVAAGQK
ncbi:hypothetical protein [Methylomarinum vadi]|uniref:hypothetical protein n=1 Tax=Methylomarinum vadi TaxID=438855 RepID=UPI0004DFB83A|nr:hypothetical protein [Methylomarinum vadi]